MTATNPTNLFKGHDLKKMLLTFSAPAVVGIIVNALYNIINRVFIGHVVGGLGIAGITVMFPVGIIFAAFGMLIGMGSNVLFSIKLGENKPEEAEKIMGNAFILLAVLSTALAIAFYIFMEPVLALLGADAEIMPYAKSFAQVVMLGIPFNAITMGFNAFLRSSGRPKIAMWTLIISAIINIVLDVVFIIWMGMEMRGAALATVIAQIVAFAWAISYFVGKKAVFAIKVKNFVIDWRTMSQAFIIGSAQFVMQTCISLVTAIFNKSLLQHGGSVAVSAIGITSSVNTLLIMPIIGISQGMQPIVGYNYGALKYRVAVQTLRLAVWWSTIFMIAAWLIIMLFSPYIVMLFNTSDLELLKASSHTLRIYNLALPLVGISVIASGFFQATNKPKQAIFLALARQFLFLVPLLMILPRIWGLDGVLWCSPVSDCISAVISFIMLRYTVNGLLKHQVKY